MAVALEQARGALFYALSKYQHLVLYPVHPSTSYAYRKAVHPSGTKDDPKDAVILLDLLTMHRDHLRVLQPDTEPMRKLQALVEQRRQMVDERTAQSNRMTQQLKLYFPQVLEWFDDLTAPIVAPTLPSAGLHHRRDFGPSAMLQRQSGVLVEGLSQSFPAAGPVMAPRLMEFGTGPAEVARAGSAMGAWPISVEAPPESGVSCGKAQDTGLIKIGDVWKSLMADA